MNHAHDNLIMDDQETLIRRARLRELIRVCFDGSRKRLIEHIEAKTGIKPNEGELSGLQKDNGPRSFGDKKAKVLCEQIGLNRHWFSMPTGTNLSKDQWLSPSPDEPAPEITSSAIERDFLSEDEKAILDGYRRGNSTVRDILMLIATRSDGKSKSALVRNALEADPASLLSTHQVIKKKSEHL